MYIECFTFYAANLNKLKRQFRKGGKLLKLKLDNYKFKDTHDSHAISLKYGSFNVCHQPA